MPVIIRDINWEETDTNLMLHIPMKGAKANKLDVLSSNQYLKVCRYDCLSQFNQVFLIGIIGFISTIFL